MAVVQTFWRRYAVMRTPRLSKTSWHNLRSKPRGFASLAAVLGTLLLASCAGTPEPVAGLAAEPYDITEVDVIISKNVNFGVESLDGSSQKELAAKLQAALKQRLTAELVVAKSQKKPARLEVVLDRIDMSSALGRTLMTLHGDSQIGGDLILKDKRTKAVIASRPALYALDDSTKVSGGGGGGVGAALAVAAMAANAAQSSDDDRIKSVVTPFTAKVKIWLGRAAAN
jgi:hypothetical protein